MIIIVGGPAGCGKSTVGNLIAERLNSSFLEGDSLHPKENIEKMSHNIPLTDYDRWSWLARVAAEASEAAEKSHVKICVAACSALKKSYRDYLRDQAPHEKVVFVFIAVEKEELFSRVSKRKNHFMKAAMVQSQLDITEVPQKEEPNCIVYWNNVDIDECVEKIKHIQNTPEAT